jgi:hypothetical protein
LKEIVEERKSQGTSRKLLEKEKLRLQQLTSDLSTRENSTLVFSTVAASASLAILIVTLEAIKPSWFGLAFGVGFLFSTLGFVYREATIFGVNAKNYEELRSLRKISGEIERRNDKRRTRILVFSRMIIIRLFLLIPTGSWILVVLNLQAAGWIALTCLILFGVAVFLSLLEYEKRRNP